LVRSRRFLIGADLARRLNEHFRLLLVVRLAFASGRLFHSLGSRVVAEIFLPHLAQLIDQNLPGDLVFILAPKRVSRQEAAQIGWAPATEMVANKSPFTKL
jgi:hypothetical protein